MPMQWTQESLWAKAQVYAERAAQEERDGPLFALWSHLAMEFLARGAVASFHPALLADRNKSVKSLLYALELGDGTEPKSVGTAESLSLCVELVPGFTTEHRDAALLMLTRRNRELHTGEPAFEDLPLSAWLADYYLVAKALLDPQGLTLRDFIGIEEAAAAEQMIGALHERVKKEVLDLIAAANSAWNGLPVEEQRARRAAALIQPREAMTKSGRCPACETGARIGGEQVVVGQTRLDSGNDLVEEIRMLPVRLECAACGLRLSGHAELHAGGLGGQFTLLRSVDPVEFHSIEIDDYVDPDRYIAISDGPEYQDE
jgi:hypothetical protein